MRSVSTRFLWLKKKAEKYNNRRESLKMQSNKYRFCLSESESTFKATPLTMTKVLYSIVVMLSAVNAC